MVNLNLYMNNWQKKAQDKTLSLLFSVVEKYPILKDNTEHIMSVLKPHERYIFENRLYDVPKCILDKIIKETDEKELKKIIDNRPLSHAVWYLITTKLQEQITSMLIEANGVHKVTKIGTDELLFDMSKAHLRPDLLIENTITGEQIIVELQQCNYTVYDTYTHEKRLQVKYHKVKNEKPILCYYEINGDIYYGLLDPTQIVTHSTRKSNKEIINAYYTNELPNQGKKPGFILYDTEIAKKFVSGEYLEMFGYEHIAETAQLAKRLCLN